MIEEREPITQNENPDTDEVVDETTDEVEVKENVVGTSVNDSVAVAVAVAEILVVEPLVIMNLGEALPESPNT